VWEPAGRPKAGRSKRATRRARAGIIVPSCLPTGGRRSPDAGPVAALSSSGGTLVGRPVDRSVARRPGLFDRPDGRCADGRPQSGAFLHGAFRKQERARRRGAPVVVGSPARSAYLDHTWLGLWIACVQFEAQTCARSLLLPPALPTGTSIRRFYYYLVVASSSIAYARADHSTSSRILPLLLQ